MKPLKFLIPFISLALVLSCSRPGSEESSGENSTQIQSPINSSATPAQELSVDEKGLSHKTAIIKTVHGNIVFKFWPQKAPATVTRIIELIQSGFYDGLIFHRVESGILVQGGDPTGTGTSGSGKKLRAELSDLQHVVGTVAMARAQDLDSADSQFYILMKELPFLDGKYTIFGQVIEGMDVVSKIKVGDKMISVVLEDKAN